MNYLSKKSAHKLMKICSELREWFFETGMSLHHFSKASKIKSSDISKFCSGELGLFPQDGCPRCNGTGTQIARACPGFREIKLPCGFCSDPGAITDAPFLHGENNE
ncbi:MAG: hypothetical protein GY730_07665 [bacterium]|nr:hypothetical protein [bacterium]